MGFHYSLYMILCLVVGIIIGWVLTRYFSPKLRQLNALENELDEAKTNLLKHQEELARHFEDSAQLLDKMAEDFRRLYQHIANNSATMLPHSHTYKNHTLQDNKGKINLDEKKGSSQPRDYSEKSSGIFNNKDD